MINILLDATSPTNIVDFIRTTGVVGILVFFLWGGYKKWWVFGWQYSELKDRLTKMEKASEDWKTLALRSTNLAESIQEIKKSGK